VRSLERLGSHTDAQNLQRYFKTGPGEYGAGDVFLGIRMPVLRRCVRQFDGTTLADVGVLLQSRYHEARMLALLLLVARYERAGDAERSQIYRTYLANTSRINNWDLVDLSASQIVGAHLEHRSRRPLYRLARSASLWERRIAVIATAYFVRRNDFRDTLALAAALRDDPEDLIHKAIGWMLREVGKRDKAALERFLTRHYHHMPRTMLRYAIERFAERERLAYLRGTR